MEPNRRLALMIDGDNAQASLLPQMLDEVSKYGTMIIRRVYGDWNTPQMESWREILHLYGLKPEYQIAYTTGKNATDMALTVDAMDMIHSGIDGICIVSSDSDYTPLATRIREKNLFIMGNGRQKTPIAFVNSCQVFIFTENLRLPDNSNSSPKLPEIKQADKSAVKVAPDGKPKLPKLKQVVKSVAKVVPDSKPKLPKLKQAGKEVVKLKPVIIQSAHIKTLLQKAFVLAKQEDGWTTLSTLGMSLRKLEPGFVSSKYGPAQLSKLLAQLHKEIPGFIKFQKRPTKSGGEMIYLRIKENA